ncbi:hypothetical protein IL992_37325 [Microbispora sp. NEAU-D428]|uniref:hypothetical protein n=1 Tax=Microbispora sitophila TaxID=2771537 RepID=UPI001865D036|nr:hypothetical protein [Microbispora sitophila]MBE3014799.1 hypothetical protein [Microbispora sitophila]
MSSVPRRLRYALGALAMVTAAATTFTATPANAATGISIRLWKIECVEQSDWGSSGDRPYFVVFIVSPNHRTGTVLVDPGIYTKSQSTYLPQTLITGNASSRALTVTLTVTVMLEQDEARDLAPEQIDGIDASMSHDYWFEMPSMESTHEKAAWLGARLRSKVDAILTENAKDVIPGNGDDDILGTSYATVQQGQATAPMSFKEDDGYYRVYYTG